MCVCVCVCIYMCVCGGEVFVCLSANQNSLILSIKKFYIPHLVLIYSWVHTK